MYNELHAITGIEMAIPIGTILFGFLSFLIGKVIQIVPSHSLLNMADPVNKK